MGGVRLAADEPLIHRALVQASVPHFLGGLTAVLHEGVGRELHLNAMIQAATPYAVTWRFLIGVQEYGSGTMYRDTLEAAIVAILDQLRGTFADFVERGKGKRP